MATRGHEGGYGDRKFVPVGSGPERTTGEPIPGRVTRSYGEGPGPFEAHLPEGEPRSTRQEAGELAQGIESKANEIAGPRQERMVDEVQGFSRGLRRAADAFRSEEAGSFGGALAGYVERFADRMSTAADSARGQDLRGMVSKASDLARREPAVFIGGALAVGFLLSRLLKVSREEV